MREPKLIDTEFSEETVIKRVFWLAWKACLRTVGQGYLRDKPDATEEDVWQNVLAAADYHPFMLELRAHRARTFEGDYIFGRRVKIEIAYAEGSLILMQPDWYGGRRCWESVAYPNVETLVHAAIQSLYWEKAA